MNVSVEMKHVTAGYQQSVAVRDFNLQVNEGERMTIIGSSGCGKTTVLKTINGLIRPISGRILVEGEDVGSCDVIRLRRRIGYVIQEVGLFPHMTIEKNVSYVCDISGRQEKRVLHRKVMQMLDTVGLEEEYAGRYPNELSGGQRQRVGIARALMAEPRIMLMDEPFGAVDEITRRHLQDELLRIQKERGLTMLFVTHDIREALKLGNRVLVMDQGEAVQCAPPEVVRKSPGSPFVAELTAGYEPAGQQN